MMALGELIGKILLSYASPSWKLL